VEEREQLKRKLVVEKDLQSFDALLDCCVTTDQVIFLIKKIVCSFSNYLYVVLPFSA